MTQTLHRCLSLAIGSYQGPRPSLLDRALQHDGALGPDSRFFLRGHTMLQRMQQFGLVKAILLDDLPADGQKGTGKALTTVWTQLSAPCGRGACRTFSTQQGKRPNRVQIACVLRQLVSHAHTHSRWSISRKSLLRQTKSLLCGILASEHHDRFLATRMFGEKSGHVQHLR